MTPTLALLAAGRSSRYGQPKQLAPLGPGGASLMTYTILDGLRSGFGRVVIITTPQLRPALEDHIGRKLGRDLPLGWAYQELAAVPRKLLHLATNRRKPWGTGQAVLAARPQLDGPFAVANADDWYGPEALQALAGWLGQEGGDDCRAATVGYPMEATLSPNGGVSRGHIHTDASGEVTRVVELFDVRRGGGQRKEMLGRDADGQQIRVPSGTPASMNLWGFRPCVLPLLADAFEAFLLERGAEEGTEFALSTAVDRLLEEDTLTLELLMEGRRWFGVTHPADTESVRARLEALHDDGTYSTPLSRSLPDRPT